ncbi:MAG: PTS sugar transporter subunit IIA [Beutenbergiaceae bacterium]
MEIFTSRNIRLAVAASNKTQALGSLASFAVELGYATDAAGVLTGMQEREELTSTALMAGIAIPHAKVEAVQSTALLIQRFNADIDWGDQPVRVTLAMLVPEIEAGSTHLQLLAQVSRALIDDDLQQLLNTGSEQEIFQEMSARLS